MKKMIIMLIILLSIVISEAISLQKQEVSDPAAQPVEQADLSLLFNNVVAYLKDGKMLSGLLIGIENTTLLVQVSGKQKKLLLWCAMIRGGTAGCNGAASGPAASRFFSARRRPAAARFPRTRLGR